MTILWIVLGTYLVICLISILHCLLRRGGVWPVFKRPAFNRLFWLMTLLSLNPLLLLIYWSIGRKNLPWTRRRALTAVACVAVVCLLTEVPWASLFDRSVAEFANGKEAKSAAFEINADVGVTESRTGSSTAYAQAGNNSEFFAMRRIAIFNQGTDRFSEGLGRELARQISQFPGVHTVTYYPAEEAAPNGARIPDLTFNLNSLSRTVLPLRAFRQSRGEVVLKGGTDPFTAESFHGQGNQPPLFSIDFTQTFNYEVRRYSISTASARVNKEIEEIAREMAKELAKKLKETAQNHPTLPELPGEFYGPESPIDDEPIAAQLNARLVMAGPSLFTTRRAIWAFQDERPTTDVLNDATEVLRAQGWEHIRPQSRSERRVTGRKGNRDVSIAPATAGPVWSAGERNDRTYYIHEVVPFERDQVQRRLEALLASNPDVDALGGFLDLARRGPHENAFIDRLKTQQPKTAALALRLARMHRGRDAAGEREYFDRARALLLLQEPNAGLSAEIKKYAKEELGIENIKDEPISNSIWDSIAIPLPDEVREVGLTLDRPLRFYWQNRAGDICLWSLEIGNEGSATEPRITYRIVHASEGRRSMSSSQIHPDSTDMWLFNHAIDSERGEGPAGRRLLVELVSEDGLAWKGEIRPQH